MIVCVIFYFLFSPGLSSPNPVLLGGPSFVSWYASESRRVRVFFLELLRTRTPIAQLPPSSSWWGLEDTKKIVALSWILQGHLYLSFLQFLKPRTLGPEQKDGVQELGAFQPWHFNTAPSVWTSMPFMSRVELSLCLTVARASWL
jgi:hypothetical protein